MSSKLKKNKTNETKPGNSRESNLITCELFSSLFSWEATTADIKIKFFILICYFIDKTNTSWRTGRGNCFTQVLPIDTY